MAEISRFFGIVIQMYLQDHDPPHFDVRYGSFSARIGIAPVRSLGGYLPPRHLALVLYWARLHQSELMECWHRIQRELPPFRIAPLE